MNSDLLFDGAVLLPHWGVIRASGVDAVKFLQGQLTNDIADMPPGQARLAGFCSAKGRLQASFIVWRDSPDQVMLACSAGLLPAVLKRMSMFVLRAQCKLTDASEEFDLCGVAGPTAGQLIGHAAPWALVSTDKGLLIRLPDALGTLRGMLISGRQSTIPLPSLPSLPIEAWRYLEVCSGIPLIEAPTVDQFVPQMLNFEILGGVDFKKGCYPGQEVVARSQYRGTIKRRMFLFECSELPQPGQEVFHDEDPEQPAGMVVNAAQQEAGAGAVALIEVKLAAIEHGSLHLGSVHGANLRRIDLPYSIPVESPSGL